MEERETIIGLEIHCQLDTKSKMFCSCSTDFRDNEPNTHTCPVCLGLPGSMPMVNKRAIEFALKVAKALNCTIRDESEFSRKNYFYPDLNKAYQITQYDKPLAEWGKLLIDGDDGEKEIRITRIHLEEDPGRSVHMGTTDRGKYTLVDYNRAGIPLIEIVTEPDLRSPKEARKFLNKLRATLEYLNVFDSEKEGSLRVDANISLKGSERVEVKNISSYKGVEKALTFEVTRQRNVLRRGQTVARETRHFVEARGVTTSSRSKEEENDYRYFPEPDLLPLRVASWVDTIELPELPDARRERFIAQYKVSPEHAKTLTGGLKLAEFYEAVASEDPALAATWTADYLLGELNYRDFSIDAMPADLFKELLALIKHDTITDKSAVEILRLILDAVKEGKKPERPQEIVSRLGLAKTSGDQVTTMIQEVITEQPAAVADYYAGKMQALNFLVGQVMKKCRGRADPGHLNTLLKEILDNKV
ncbi:Asp-tRNA(Asn)/Glu-tRNA(Gln) amidotransferase subunit GatB [Methanospirillum sp. J.3.6.1-F.2.7.3]|uniref:Aspartyl/glutamyl-tRNA(Asn/Gln) amidotransferase subunit B n=1 Tax=Methanospirillum purgamenti TaxID=2834276 RepID=A0A8E7AYZ7_9EURY|nr:MULTISPECIES: Asp-tRNA(Asn)/Glu-tRNA(Gln) amidotransferase subunit GatB [Methanospirillum]MDX8550305.1 Asp-tRNA(Asn)/Glu-tRNA(Gln) amidotransferase subunit GatB [Methanospirillum hungatei]QVV88031.1 Asp-tRNA(Asn)/Glu-tRNA(Gln) amidotransferase subunit GatB [Methanospirillum sp. J.3.6.1-F.2.7.3]